MNVSLLYTQKHSILHNQFYIYLLKIIINHNFSLSKRILKKNSGYYIFSRGRELNNILIWRFHGCFISLTKNTYIGFKATINIYFIQIYTSVWILTKNSMLKCAAFAKKNKRKQLVERATDRETAGQQERNFSSILGMGAWKRTNLNFRKKVSWMGVKTIQPRTEGSFFQMNLWILMKKSFGEYWLF